MLSSVFPLFSIHAGSMSCYCLLGRQIGQANCEEGLLESEASVFFVFLEAVQTILCLQRTETKGNMSDSRFWDDGQCQTRIVRIGRLMYATSSTAHVRHGVRHAQEHNSSSAWLVSCHRIPGEAPFEQCALWPWRLNVAEYVLAGCKSAEFDRSVCHAQELEEGDDPDAPQAWRGQCRFTRTWPRGSWVGGLSLLYGKSMIWS